MHQKEKRKREKSGIKRAIKFHNKNLVNFKLQNPLEQHASIRSSVHLACFSRMHCPWSGPLLIAGNANGRQVEGEQMAGGSVDHK